jgi:hypothetical protein
MAGLNPEKAISARSVKSNLSIPRAASKSNVFNWPQEGKRAQRTGNVVELAVVVA